MLKAMGLPLPKQILVHGWWQKDGAKISKSTGNIVDPVAVINEWGLDAFRFYVLRELDIGPDGNWTDAGFKSRYSGRTGQRLGQSGQPLALDAQALSQRRRAGEASTNWPPTPRRRRTKPARCSSKTNFRPRCKASGDWSPAPTNTWTRPRRSSWPRTRRRRKRLDEVLYNLAETCRVLAVLLWPFLPGTAAKIYAQLGLTGAPDKLDAATWGGLPAGHTIGEPAPLFPRKEM